MIEKIERVVCDMCSSSGPEVKNGEAARLAAEAEGWIHRENCDLCPRCKQKTQPRK